MDIEIWKRVGVDGIAQVDIGERRQPHQPLKSLGGMASTILAAVCARLADEGRMDAAAVPPADFMVRPALAQCR
jgi:hypothetical protein